MLRIVIDTNIYISAILFAGKPESIIKLAAAEKVTLYTSHAITADVAGVLKNKFSWTNQQVEYTDQFLRDISVLVTPTGSIDIIKTDDADNRILECALECKADYIVTGDRKHLLTLKRYQGTAIVDSAEFLEIYENTKSF